MSSVVGAAETNPWASPEYLRQRRAILATRPRCVYCGAPGTEVDHVPPISRHEHVALGVCCKLVPSCFGCAREQGGLLRVGRHIADPDDPDVLVAEPAGYDADHPVWRRPWLEPLLDVPANAVWPRLMTPPHPEAVGSLGDELAARVAERRGKPLRWWQRLVSVRVLEVDAAGALCWDALVLSLARQLGKSWWLSDYLFDRIHQADHFGEEQYSLHVASNLSVAKEVQRHARTYAKARPDDYRVREVNGQESIEHLGSGSRYALRAREATYGLSATVACADEAWKIPSTSIEEALEPTMTEREQPQLLLVSTAHRKATSLMLNRRQAALDHLDDDPGGGELLIEWSTPRWMDLGDHAGWRLASPHWTAQRERILGRRLAAAKAGEVLDVDEPDPLEAFRAQWLNQWPLRRDTGGRGERLLADGAWAALTEDVEPTVRPWVAVEDWYGEGAAAAAAALLADGRVVVGGFAFDRRAEAFAWAAEVARHYQGCRLIVGATLVGDEGVKAVPHRGDVQPATGPLTRTGLSAIRQLVADGRIVHDGGGELGDAVEACRVVPQVSGLALSGGRQDLIKAAAWVVAEAARPRPRPAIA